MVAESEQNDAMDAALSGTIDSTTLTALLNNREDDGRISIDPCASALAHTVSVILTCLATSPQSKASDKFTERPGTDAFISRTNDVIRLVSR